MIEELLKHASKYTDEEFEVIVEQNFTTVLNSGKEVELCPDGKEKMVTKSNLDDFIKLLLKARFEEGL